MTSRTQSNPVQFRLPRPGEVDPWWQANRSFWNERVLPTERNGFKPEIKSVVVKQPGRKRGVRFIVFKSAQDYWDKVHHQEEEQAA